MKQGITKAEYSDAGADSWTDIDNLVAQESQAEFTLPGEDTTDPKGNQYFGGEVRHLVVRFLDATAYGALKGKYADDDQIDLRVTLADGETTVVLAGILPVVRRDTVQGQLGGRTGFRLDVRDFALTPY